MANFRNNAPSAQEVKEELENGYVTKRTLSENFEVCVGTIETRLRLLRDDGVPIIHGNNGLRVIDKGVIQESLEDAAAMSNMVEWWLGQMKGLTRLISPIKPLLPTMRKTLAINMSPEERQDLRLACAKTVALLTVIDAQEEE